MYANAANLKPFTVYTLKNSPHHRQTSDSVIGAKILSIVAGAVLASPDPQTATIDKKFMAKLLQEDKENDPRNIASLKQLLQIFKGDTMLIINNKALESILCDIAENTTKYLKNANKTIEENIHSYFLASMNV